MRASQRLGHCSFRPKTSRLSHPGAARISWVRSSVHKHFDAALGRRLRERREQLQLTLKDVAERCGVGYQLIHKYECGYVQISAYRLWQLALILKVQVGYFFRELDPAQFAPVGPTGGKSPGRKVNPA